ncbi:signal peptidase I [Salipaludibacillus agaradhaerens]|uniref:signal peptidase I n=1 Tax=Salipaludibacillus agaradhaerens TaxID=76935 RepID=UPI002ADDC24C|nr:signal peptidase I [Salipaludibacillus agaradhaerens]
MNMESNTPEATFPEKPTWKTALWSLTKLLTVVVIIGVIIRGFLFTNYIVYGQSMMPTINDGERIIVNKLDYELVTPSRFDLIIFHATEESDYIKRIIGLPGDTVEYKNDILYINGKVQEETFLDDFKETHENGLFTDDFTLEQVTGESEIPEGYVFVLGDNRQNSVDSRHIGLVPIKEIVGKANITFWPLTNIRLLS